jgi:hypothetical protein
MKIFPFLVNFTIIVKFSVQIFICEKLHLGFMKVRTSSRLAREQCRELLNAVITPVSSISIEDLRILAEIPDGIEDGMLRVNNITMNISPNYF